MTYLIALLGFAFVIFIHELGHFVFAKWAGVRVDTFSIGMGPVIWSKQIGETEYALSLLPVGGYVKMLGQEDVPGRAVDDADERSFVRKHPAWRAAILFGGVLFNLVSSYLILVALAWYGVPVFPPVVGELQQYVQDEAGGRLETAAWRLGLNRGDRIISVNGERVRSYQDMLMKSLAADSKQPIAMRIERDGQQLQLPADGGPVHLEYDPQLGRPDLGIRPAQGLTILGAVGLQEAPEQAPQPGERLVAVGDQRFDQRLGQDVLEQLVPHVGQEITVTLARGGEERQARFRYAGDLASGADLLAAGLGLPVLVVEVLEDRPAAQAGLQPGDVILAVNDQTVSSGAHFKALLRQAVAEGQQARLRLMRWQDDGWQEQVVELPAAFDARSGQLMIGIAMSHLAGGQLPALPPALGQDESPLAQAGLRAGDGVVDIDFDPAATRLLRLADAEQRLLPFVDGDWHQLSRSERPMMLMRLINKLFGLSGPPSVFQGLAGARVATPLEAGGTGLTVETLGQDGELHSRFVNVRRLSASGRVALQRLQAGDWISTAPGVARDGRSALVVLRSDASAEWLPVTPASPGLALALLPEEVPYQLSSWTEAFSYANDETVQMITTTLTLIPRFFQAKEDGGIDASKSLQGPIGIFSELSARFEYLGFSSFLKLVALIGLNLFLINLLPIPIVDGGQLLFLFVEIIIRRPVPLRVQEALNWCGFALVVSLMLYVIGNDIVNRL